MTEVSRVAPRLIVFTDTTRAAPALLLARFKALAERAATGGVLFMLRDYQLALRARWALAEQLAKLAERTRQGFGIAERADLAHAFGCHAFHLPQSGLLAADARHYLGPEVFLSRGSHDPTQLAESELDAVLLSPIFEARKGRPALGVAKLKRPVGVAKALYALGGVNEKNAASCLIAEAAGVAVIGAALAPDPEPMLSALGILISAT